jgi:hypothetical protein
MAKAFPQNTAYERRGYDCFRAIFALPGLPSAFAQGLSGVEVRSVSREHTKVYWHGQDGWHKVWKDSAHFEYATRF